MSGITGLKFYPKWAKFHYCAYWGTYSRILSNDHRLPEFPNHLGSIVEVNLTPVNPYYQEGWDRNKDIIIRRHGTSPGKNDQFYAVLPPEIWKLLDTKYGKELRHRLVTEDFVSQIDWNKYHKACNGGAKLADCLKDVDTKAVAQVLEVMQAAAQQKPRVPFESDDIDTALVDNLNGISSPRPFLR